MKKIIIVVIVMFFVSCSKDDDSNNLSNDLVKQVVLAYSYGGNSSSIISYDNNNRDADWTYTDLQLTRELSEPVYSNGNPFFTYKVNLNTKGNVSEVYTTILGHGYSRMFTYDDKNRIIKEEIYSQNLNIGTGVPLEEFGLYQTYTYTWDDANNLISMKDVRPDSDEYFLTTYSDFSAKIKNTLKPVNFGFNYFGLYGYNSEETNGGGNGGFYFRSTYAGEYMPAKKVLEYFNNATNVPFNSYISMLTYQRDNMGRITEVYEESEIEEGIVWTRKRYSY